jgi:uncharacterized protein YneF (UPF0154 family)
MVTALLSLLSVLTAGLIGGVFMSTLRELKEQQD